jgi:hypothetical protein
MSALAGACGYTMTALGEVEWGDKQNGVASRICIGKFAIENFTILPIDDLVFITKRL